MAGNDPSVGIGILNWNGKKFLEQFLHHLYLVTYPNLTIYVIDNDSTDDSIHYLQTHHPAVKIIETGGNFGVAGGYNRGFEKMPEKYLLMLNSDVEVTPGFLEPLVELLEQNTNIAVVQPKILSFQDRTRFEHAGAAGGMIDILGYPFCRGRIFENVELDKGFYNDTAEIFWASGACCLIRKSAFDRVNGFYEYFFMHSEEIDLCWRMIAAGYQVFYHASSSVYHLGGGSLHYNSSRKIYFNFRNNIIMCYKNSPILVRLWLIPLRCILDLMAISKFLAGGQFSFAKAVLNAYGSFCKWTLSGKQTKTETKSLDNISIVLNKSIVFEYYINGKKTYHELRK
ncbi:MAG: glycosyltransferase family 2 protein [Bacteroidota bacterium]